MQPRLLLCYYNLRITILGELSRALQYVLFTQATINYLTTNETKNALPIETVISNYIGGDPISHSLGN